MSASHALITGGSSGIGLALAKRLAASGSDVTIIARGTEALSAARTAIEAQRRNSTQRVLALTADVADEAAVDAAVKAAVESLGPPDLLVTSAGVVFVGRFEEMPVSDFRRSMDINYLGTLYTVRAALPAMRKKPGSHIALISSGAAFLGLYGYTSYAPSKFAVRGLGEALRCELAPEGIGVSVVYPPDTDTPMLKDEIPHRPPALAAIAASSRVLSVEEVANAILVGIARKRASIAPGLEMRALARLHSLIGPLLYRFWLDRVVARHHGVGRSKSS